MAWAEQYVKGYRGRYKDADDKNRTARSARTKRDALALARAEEERIRKGTWVNPDAGRMRFAEYFEHYWAPSRVVEGDTLDANWSHYRSSLRGRFGHVELRKNSGVVQDRVKELVDAGVAPGTINATFKTLSPVLGGRRGRSAVRDRRISENPCAGVVLPRPQPREVAIYGPEQVQRLIEHLPEWWRPLLAVDVETGLRWGAPRP